MELPALERLTRELSLRKRLQEALFVFSRSLTARLDLESALETLAIEVTVMFGVRRTCIWMHDRKARMLTLSASSDPRDGTAVIRVRTDEDSPIARGLRSDTPEISGEGDAQQLIVSLRGWQRALGTLVIEGQPTQVATGELIDLAADLARQVSVTIERLLLLDNLLRDVRQQAALRSQLAQAEKLASLGQFVAGIAHELNNPLQVILGHAELLLDQAPAGSNVADGLNRILIDADRSAKIVQNLLMFTGSRHSVSGPVDMTALLNRAIASREAVPHPAGVRIVQRGEASLPAVVGDAAKLERALLNVLINAEQAIASSGAGGEITVTKRSGPQRLWIEIQDSGPGIAAEVVPRIFEPFFTTRDVGQGTGLGLAVTYGIIQEHGGSITVTSSPRGATFTIELPAAGDKVASTGSPS